MKKKLNRILSGLLSLALIFTMVNVPTAFAVDSGYSIVLSESVVDAANGIYKMTATVTGSSATIATAISLVYDSAVITPISSEDQTTEGSLYDAVTTDVSKCTVMAQNESDVTVNGTFKGNNISATHSQGKTFDLSAGVEMFAFYYKVTDISKLAKGSFYIARTDAELLAIAGDTTVPGAFIEDETGRATYNCHSSDSNSVSTLTTPTLTYTNCDKQAFGSAELTMDQSEVTVTAAAQTINVSSLTVKDTDGDPMLTDPDSVTYSISGDTGVIDGYTPSKYIYGAKINSSTGEVTVSKFAVGGTVTVTASVTYGSVTREANATIEIIRPASVLSSIHVVTGTDLMILPVPSTTEADLTRDYNFFGEDQFNLFMEIPEGYTAAWSVNPTTGVSVNDDGLVTVTSEAAKNFTADATITDLAIICTLTKDTESFSDTYNVKLTKNASIPYSVVVEYNDAVFDEGRFFVPSDTESEEEIGIYPDVTVYDQYGVAIAHQADGWNVTCDGKPVPGVAFNGETLTITNEAKGTFTDFVGKNIYITATYGNVTSAPKAVKISRALSVATSIELKSGTVFENGGTDIIGIPGNKTYTAEVVDQYGEKMTDANLALSDADDGFSYADGTVTVAETAADGATATLTASYSDMTPVAITITAKTVAVNWPTLNENATMEYGGDVKTLFSNWSDRGTATAYIGSEAVTLNGTFSVVTETPSAGDEQTVTINFTVDANTVYGGYSEQVFTNSYNVKVTPKTVSVVWTNTDLTYNGLEQKPTATVTGLNGNLAVNVTVEGTYTNAGTYSASAVISDTNYILDEATANQEYTIAKRELTITEYIVQNKTYDGETQINVRTTDCDEINLKVSGYIEVEDGQSVEIVKRVGSGSDLEVLFTAAYDRKDAGERTVTFSNLQLQEEVNYVLAATGHVTTASATISQKEVTVSGITAVGKEYDGNTTATLNTSAAEFDGIVEGDTLTVTATGEFASENANEENPSTVNITGLTLGGASADNYKLADSGNQTSATATIRKKPLTITNGDVVITKEFNDSTAAGALTGDLGLSGVVSGETVTVDMSKVTVGEYPEENIGTYTVTLTIADGFIANPNYSVPATFAFNNAKITKTTQKTALVIAGAENKTFGAPEFTITVTGGDSTGAYDLKSSDPAVLKLTKTADGVYTATILKVGTVTLTANRAGDQNYEAAPAVTAEITVAPKTIVEGDFTFATDGTFTYNGKEHKPAVTSTALTAGTDFEVAYSANINAGSVTITVTGKGNYTGTVTKNFTISPKSIAAETVKVADIADVTFTGSAIAPLVTITDSETGKTLVNGTDYTLAYANNTNAGTATITVTGKGNYTGSAPKTFVINAAVASGTVTIDGSYAVATELTAVITNGKTATVTYQWLRDGVAIEGATQNTYTLTNDDAGKMISVKVTSTGNYVGELTSAAIEVGKTPLTGSVAVEESEGVLTATITTTATTDDYSIVWLRDGAVISGATETTYTLTAADKGHTISAKIVAKGDTFTGEVTGTGYPYAATKPAAPAVTATAGNGQVTVKWTVSDNGGSAILNYKVTVGTTTYDVSGTATSFVVNDLTNGTEYTFSVVAINSVGTSDAGSATATPKAGSGYVPPVLPPVGGGTTGGTTTTNPDGSTTTTTEDKTTGTVTETTKNTDGSTTVVETQKDGTVTETNTTADGITGTTVTESNGRVSSVEVEIPTSVINKADEPVTLPVEIVATSNPYIAPEIQITASAPVEVEIPVVNPSAGTVAIIVHEDGTEEIVRYSVAGDDGLYVPLDGSATVKVVDNSKSFGDMYGHWATDAVDFASSHELFNGVSAYEFAPSAEMTRAMLVTVLFRLNNEEGAAAPNFGDVASGQWFSDAIGWASENGIVGGVSENDFAPNQNVTREQLATILYRYAKAMGMDTSAAGSLNGFSDSSSHSDWASEALEWAVGCGLIGGKPGNKLDASGTANRAEVATIFMRFVEFAAN